MKEQPIGCSFLCKFTAMKEEQIYGIHSTLEALRAEQNIEKIFLQKALNSEAFKEISTLAREQNIAVSYVPIQKLNRLSQENHQGCIAKISPITYQSLEEMVEQAFAKTQTPLFLILDQITDVRNLGAIIRTAECTGVNGLILPSQGGAMINEQTVKTSSGAVFNLPIAKVNHIKDALFFLDTYKVIKIAATEKAKQSIYKVDLKQASVIIMGSEGKGVNPSILKMVDHEAKLPLLGETSSLNVSVACGVFLYEALRQRLGD